MFFIIVPWHSLYRLIAVHNFELRHMHIRRQKIDQHGAVLAWESIEWEAHGFFIWILAIANTAIGQCIATSAGQILVNAILIVVGDHYE